MVSARQYRSVGCEVAMTKSQLVKLLVIVEIVLVIVMVCWAL